MILRTYQQEAVNAVYKHIQERDDNPCVVIPTAGGKTPILATICKDAVQKWHGRVLVLAHVKEILEQAADKLRNICPDVNFGIYSAGLKRRDTSHSVIVAGIQSIYKRACELDSFDLIIVDECHLISLEGDGMYRTFLKEAKAVNPNLRIIGLTATPFRMKSGSVCGPDNILNKICYEIGVKELIINGYICNIITKASKKKIDTSGLHIRAGEFIASETEELMNNNDVIFSACSEIVEHTKDRKSVLVFASGVKHGENVARVLRAKCDDKVETVFGDTLTGIRNQRIEDFRNRKIKYLINVNVLTTGFDATNIDCVAMLRPTNSPGLFYQMTGRGFRLHPEKDDCLVLDFGNNVMRHGPIDQIRFKDSEPQSNQEAPAKECPKCRSLIACGYAVCPDCGYVFPEPEQEKHDGRASTDGILSGQSTLEEYTVEKVFYSVHEKVDAPKGAPTTMRVEYQIGWQRFYSEWICFEHVGWPRQKAESWWMRRSNALIPQTTEEAVNLAKSGAVCKTKAITVKITSGEDFPRIVGYKIEEKPFWREPGSDDDEVIKSAEDQC